MNILIEYEQVIRISIFICLLAILLITESVIPLAKRKCNRIKQWSINLALVVINNLSLTLLLPVLAVGAAQYAFAHRIGFFNVVDFSFWPAFILSLVLLDLLIYGQHVMMHKLPILWRLHRVHHTELGLDVTTAVRFHPIEIILSMLIKISFVVIMGIPIAAVIIFEVLLNGFALFNHSNIKLNITLEKQLRKWIVTPEIHWIHHSQLVKETNSNYGFNLVIWDKLFSTYRDKPSVDYKILQQGLKEFPQHSPLNIYQLIILPFKDK